MGQFRQENFPFNEFLPRRWQCSDGEAPVYSVPRSHGLKVKIRLNHGTDKVNTNRDVIDHTLISYEVNERRYDLFTYRDLELATYALDDTGVTNMIGDLAESIARRIMKRFLQLTHRGYGHLGGLFDKRFNPKQRKDFIVASTENYILKIGRYPNMILLKKTGVGKWGFQHVTDLDGLFDYRTGMQRQLVILESKSGKIDQNPETLYEKTIAPMQELFPDAQFSYVLFATKNHLFLPKDPEYRILQKTPERIYESLLKRGVPTMFFCFQETEKDFHEMARHLILSYRSYNAMNFHIKGETEISPDHIRIFEKGNAIPYIELKKDPESGLFRIKNTSYRPFQEEKANT